MHLIGMILVWLVALMIIYVGIMYLAKNEKNAAGFGLPVLPDASARAWWQLKGSRDIVSGIAPIVLIFAQPDALPWLILVESLIAIADMLVILANGGSRGRAFGIHGVTAGVMIIAVVLLWVG